MGARLPVCRVQPRCLHGVVQWPGLFDRLALAGECIASHKSVRRCTFNQNSGPLRNNRARMSAVGAVIARGRCMVH
jgi:hypothetical protein